MAMQLKDMQAELQHLDQQYTQAKGVQARAKEHLEQVNDNVRRLEGAMDAMQQLIQAYTAKEQEALTGAAEKVEKQIEGEAQPEA